MTQFAILSEKNLVTPNQPINCHVFWGHEWRRAEVTSVVRTTSGMLYNFVAVDGVPTLQLFPNDALNFCRRGS